jgi:hypothetical protein
MVVGLIEIDVAVRDVDRLADLRVARRSPVVLRVAR